MCGRSRSIPEGCGAARTPPFPLLLRYYLDDVQKGQNSQYDSDHDQGMDPASAIRPVVIPGTPTEETKQPKNKQDYDNGPQHEITPFE